MKKISIFAMSLVSAVGITPWTAQAQNVSHLAANGIAVHNIATMQHSIMHNTFNNFDRTIANSLDKPFVADDGIKEETKPVVDPTKDYGKMATYGEYGDDGTVFTSGRSGGDFDTTNTTWLDWQHTQDYAKFDGFNKVDSRFDIISLGFSDTPEQLNSGISEFGGFGGVIISSEDSGAVELTENGEYIGLYYAYHSYGFNLNTAVNFGTLFSDTKSGAYGKYDLTNMWAGAALNASYNVLLDDTSVLQPGLYGGYTWVYSDGYKTDTGHDISFDNFYAFELSPSLRAITHIHDSWVGIVSARYVFNFTDGGDLKNSVANIPDLDMKDYLEYGLSFEKNTNNFSLAVSLNRRDRGRTGWNGGLHMRYRF